MAVGRCLDRGDVRRPDVRAFGLGVCVGPAAAVVPASGVATAAADPAPRASAVAVGSGASVAVGATVIAVGAVGGASVGGSAATGAGVGGDPSANKEATSTGVAARRTGGAAARARSTGADVGVGGTEADTNGPVAGGVAHAPASKATKAMSKGARRDGTRMGSAFPTHQADSIDDTPAA